jgi:asparagine synthase (glutamine-hydrolysing)
MCGITGFVGPGDGNDLARMMSALAHRGPDGAGTHCEPDAGLYLGHQRLAIVDVADGAQPMWNASGSICVIFNGEIYNHRALRAELESLGHKFRTDHSDTEVLIHGYCQWGEDLPARLNGMFAFCIYDRLARKLFLSRDRMGEKPLYYAQQGKLFAFASELTAITRHTAFSSRLRRTSLQKLLAYGFLPAPNAILEDCAKLPGGWSMSFDLRSGTLRTWRYWQFQIETNAAWMERPEGELVEELRAHLFEAVRRRLVADVPLGFFLSGGVDSSAIVAGARRHMPAGNIRTFTLGFSEPSFDESRQARQVAEALGVHNAVEYLDLDVARDTAPSLLARLEEPSCDASVLPTYLLSRFTRGHVKVALSGDGGDELFAGYDPFAALAPARLYSSLVPQPLHALLSGAARRLPVSNRNMSLDFKLRRTLTGLSYPPSMWNPAWLSPVDPAHMVDLMHDPMSAEELYSEAIGVWEAGGQKAVIDRSLEFYTRFYLQDDILTKVDRASMLCSLESRAVFLDNDVVDFCRRLPHQFKMRKGQRKYLLKKALEGVLPQHIINRPKKGFGIPTAKWLKTMPAKPPLKPTPGVRMQKVAQAWADHRTGKADNRLFLWSWLSLQSLEYFGAMTAGLPIVANDMQPPAPTLKAVEAP